MKMDPMPARPTNRDLGDRLVQVHDCQERHQRKATEHFRKINDEILEIKGGMGLLPGQKPTIATNTGRQSFVRTALATGTSLGAFGGLFMAYRAVVFLAPATWHWLVVLNHLILTGKL